MTDTIYRVAQLVVLMWLPVLVYYFIPSDDRGYMQ